MQHLIEVTEEFDGMMLLDFLCQNCRDRSVAFLRKLVARGDVRLGDKRCAVTDIVHTGDVFEASIADDEGIIYQPQDRQLAAVYEDRRVLALHKPAGLSVLPERRHRQADFLNGAWYYLCHHSPYSSDGDAPRPLVVHRLDREASGVVVLAKDAEALRLLSEQFAGHSVSKQYLALVHGRPTEPAGTIDLPLAVDRRAVTVRVDRREGKPSVTHYAVEEQYRTMTLLSVRPVTGRLHQIRLHLKEAGLPIVCDPAYGDGAPLLLSSFKRGYRPKPDRDEPPLISRLALHAYRLSFVTPDGERQVEVEAPLPKDFALALKMLRKYSASAGPIARP